MLKNTIMLVIGLAMGFVGFMFVNGIESKMPPAYVMQIHHDMDLWRSTMQGNIDGKAFMDQMDKEYAAVLKANGVKIVSSNDVSFELLVNVLLFGALAVALVTITIVMLSQVSVGITTWLALAKSLREG